MSRPAASLAAILAALGVLAVQTGCAPVEEDDIEESAGAVTASTTNKPSPGFYSSPSGYVNALVTPERSRFRFLLTWREGKHQGYLGADGNVRSTEPYGRKDCDYAVEVLDAYQLRLTSACWSGPATLTRAVDTGPGGQ